MVDVFWIKLFEKVNKLSSSNNQVVSTHLLIFINLKKCLVVAIIKLQKTHQIKIPKKTQVSSPWKKSKKCWSKSLNHTRKNIKSYLAANNELLSKRMNELNGKPNDSIEHPDQVNLEKFKAMDRDVIHVNANFRNHEKR